MAQKNSGSLVSSLGVFPSKSLSNEASAIFPASPPTHGWLFFMSSYLLAKSN